MFRFDRYTALGLIALLSAAQPVSAAGPVSTLYVMNYGEFGGGSLCGLDLFQGLSVNSFPTASPVDICIGVAGGDVRTMGYTQADQGTRFNLAGGPLGGGPYVNTIANSQLHDGTSDGQYNYSVNYTTGDVLRFDRNWAGPSVMFNAWGTLNSAGYITMDTSDGSFWLSEWGGPDRVEHRTASGTLLSSFNFGILGTAGLALDPADGTLWTSNGSNTLYQFSTSGTLLQTQAYSISGQFYGMEFETTPVPEPAAMILMLIGVSAVRTRRRRTA